MSVLVGFSRHLGKYILVFAIRPLGTKKNTLFDVTGLHCHPDPQHLIHTVVVRIRRHSCMFTQLCQQTGALVLFKPVKLAQGEVASVVQRGLQEVQ